MHPCGLVFIFLGKHHDHLCVKNRHLLVPAAIGQLSLADVFLGADICGDIVLVQHQNLHCERTPPVFSTIIPWLLEREEVISMFISGVCCVSTFRPMGSPERT